MYNYKNQNIFKILFLFLVLTLLRYFVHRYTNMHHGSFCTFMCLYIFFGAQQNIVRYMFGLFKLLYLFLSFYFIFIFTYVLCGLFLLFIYFCTLYSVCIICWFESLSNQFLTHFLWKLLLLLFQQLS